MSPLSLSRSIIDISSVCTWDSRQFRLATILIMSTLTNETALHGTLCVENWNWLFIRSIEAANHLSAFKSARIYMQIMANTNNWMLSHYLYTSLSQRVGHFATLQCLSFDKLLLLLLVNPWNCEFSRDYYKKGIAIPIRWCMEED